MATQPVSDRFVTVEEYLATSYEPDCEYDKGSLVERNVGEIEHSYIQALLATLFTNQTEAWQVYGLPEQRVQIAPNRFLVPDLCVVPVSAPWQKVLKFPPLVVIEILSPDDTRRHAEAKAAEYRQFGVTNIWVIDPYARVAYRSSNAELERVSNGELKVPGTSIEVRVAELFEKLDQLRERSGKR